MRRLVNDGKKIGEISHTLELRGARRITLDDQVCSSAVCWFGSIQMVLEARFTCFLHISLGWSLCLFGSRVTQ